VDGDREQGEGDMRISVIALGLALVGLLGGTSIARADATICTGVLNGYFDSVVVPINSSCTLNLATIAEDVKVSNGATLSIIGQSISPTGRGRGVVGN
jgi:hypothetical protein